MDIELILALIFSAAFLTPFLLLAFKMRTDEGVDKLMKVV
jgi:hypothetical protein